MHKGYFAPLADSQIYAVRSISTVGTQRVWTPGKGKLFFLLSYNSSQMN